MAKFAEFDVSVPQNDPVRERARLASLHMLDASNAAAVMFGPAAVLNGLLTVYRSAVMTFGAESESVEFLAKLTAEFTARLAPGGTS